MTAGSPDPLGHIRALIEKYTVITFTPEIEAYRPLPSPKKGSCIFRGCPEPIAWEDSRGGNFLCKGHYLTMKMWIDEARKALISGERSALFDEAISRK